jgi:hypothetical protein
VAVTRARRHLVVVGHAGMLHQNQQWKEIIQRAKSLPGGSREIQEYLVRHAWQSSGRLLCEVCCEVGW